MPVDRKKLTIRWEQLKADRATKPQRLKALSDEFGVSQKELKETLLKAGLWYDSKAREEEWKREAAKSTLRATPPVSSISKSPPAPSYDAQGHLKTSGSKSVEHVAGCTSTIFTLAGGVLFIMLIGMAIVLLFRL